MDKNIAAILRQDTKTIGVVFGDGFNQTKAYTYVSSESGIEVGDTVIVPNGSDDNYKLATVVRVDEDLEIEPNSSVAYRWIVCKVNFDNYANNLSRNKEIEKKLAGAYRTNARQAYAQQFLVGASEDVMALVNGK
jgi:hypothetical protein